MMYKKGFLDLEDLKEGRAIYLEEEEKKKKNKRQRRNH